MFIIKIFRWIKGSLLFRIYGEAETLISILSENRVKLWDIHKKNGKIYANAYLREYKKIAKYTKKLPCRTKIKNRNGLPFIIIRHRKRIGVFLGILLCTGFLILMQNFIWRIEVRGNENLSASRIIKIAEICGIYKGAFLPGINIPNAEQQMKVKLEDISWVAINRKGSKIEIVVWEAAPKPSIDEKNPCNVIAKKQGQIIYMDVYNGQKVLHAGDAVDKGDLIISGMVEDKKGNLTLKHANAMVIARTKTTKTYNFPLSTEEIRYTGKEKNRYIFSVFDFKIPLFINTKIGDDYEINPEYKNIVLFGFEMPFGLYKNTHKQFETIPVLYSEEEARELLYAEIKRTESEEMNEDNGIKIIFKSIKETVENGIMIIKVDYICEEDIAELSEIQVEN